MMIMFFISNQLSPYFRSPVFDAVLKGVTKYSTLFNMKQSEGKLKIVTRGIDSLEKAYSTLRKLGKSDK